MTSRTHSGSQPALPPRPFPLQLFSLLLRLPLALLAGFELWIQRLFQLLVRPRYRVEGRCQSNAVCCHHILLVEGRFARLPVIRVLNSFWLSGVHRFRPTANLAELPDGREARIYRCDNLGADRRCREHALRPLVCRQYPRPGFFAPPSLHRGCGYRVIDRVSGEQVSPVEPVAPGTTDVPAEQLVRRWKATRDD